MHNLIMFNEEETLHVTGIEKGKQFEDGLVINYIGSSYHGSCTIRYFLENYYKAFPRQNQALFDYIAEKHPEYII